MTKRKMTKQQRLRIAQAHAARRQRADQRLPVDAEPLGPEQSGTVIAYFGKMAEVEAVDARIYHCNLRQHVGVLVPGDQVIWRPAHGQTGVIVALCPREKVLAKPDRRGALKPIAANIDQVLVVVAIEPGINTLSLDSYLLATEYLTLPTLIVCNKIDLPQASTAATVLAVYQQMAYPVLSISVLKRQGLSELRDMLQEKTSVFVGQSGVGKSSMIAALLPDETVKIGAVAKSGLGSHTTSTARLYHVPKGGRVIDSPGIRAFTLGAMMPDASLASYFRDFVPFLKCKYYDCLHIHEPGCAIIAAVRAGDIARERWANYQKLIESLKS